MARGDRDRRRHRQRLHRGIAEAPTQAVEGAEVANAASKVAKILRALVELARTVAETIGGLLTKVAETAAKLKKFVNLKVEKALVKVGEKLGWSRLSKQEKDAYEAYVKRKGATAKSPEECKRLKDQIAVNKANGDAYEAEMMVGDGVTAGKDGWSTQVTHEGRRWDYANELEQKAVEVEERHDAGQGGPCCAGQGRAGAQGRLGRYPAPPEGAPPYPDEAAGRALAEVPRLPLRRFRMTHHGQKWPRTDGIRRRAARREVSLLGRHE